LITLLALLTPYKAIGETNWPRTPKSLGDALRRLAPALRMLGFECKADQKQSGQIVWHINPVGPKVLNPCPSNPSCPNVEISPLDLDGQDQDMQDMQDMKDMENTVLHDAPSPSLDES
jgi:hypothetical protein